MNTVIIIVVSIVGTLLFLLIAVALLWWWIKKKMKGFMSGLMEMAGAYSAFAPPLVIELEPQEEPDWSNTDAVESEQQALLDAGFTEAGVFEIDEMGGVTLMGLVNETDRTLAAIYEHESAGVWCDITQVDEAGNVYGVTSGPEPNLAIAPWKSGGHHTGAPVSELLRHFKDGQPSTPRPPVQPTDFKAVFEREYEREMQWHVDRGGPTEEEIRRIAEKSGQEVDDDMIAQVREHWQENINEKLEGDLRKAFLATGQVSAAEWDELQHRTVFIHDSVPTSEILNHYMSVQADDEDEEDDDDSEERYDQQRDAAKAKIKGLSARDAFVLLNDDLPEDRRYRKIGMVESPITTEVYAAQQTDWD